MTRSEFTKRTFVEVSDKEFDAIEMVYMHSDLNKDEFCKMWMKMNNNRVHMAKVERKIKATGEAYRDALYKFFTKTATYGENFGDQFSTLMCYVKVSTYEIQAMSYAGIKLENKFLSDVRHEIGKYLGIF